MNDNNQSHSFAFNIYDKENLKMNGDETLLPDCGATTHIVNSDENLIDIDTTFKPAEHFIELAEGSKSNNVALKRGTYVTYLKSI